MADANPTPERDRYAALPLFVYGTLRPGLGNHPLYCHDAVRARPATMPGRLYQMTDGYPVFVPGPEGAVRGELLDFPDTELALKRIDPLEGIGVSRADWRTGDYEREIFTATLLEDGTPVEAWCYVATSTQLIDAALVESGDWKQHGGRPI
ncbi:MAG: gamma-glutamylcyclotransferase family protein [Planctomycetota bacterium]|jgi:gamma-glutamylcyclotransferase (GGCT)/AIG2-like uncharacterized protein YtfP